MKTAIGMMLLLSLWATGCATLEPPAGTIAEGESLAAYRQVVLTVYGMSCPLCSNNLSGRLMKIQGVEDVTIDLKTGAVSIVLAEHHEVKRAAFAAAVKEAGFTLKAIQSVPAP